MKNNKVFILFSDNVERESILNMLSARCINQFVTDNNPHFMQIELTGPTNAIGESGTKMIEGINVLYIRMCVKHYLLSFLPNGHTGKTIRVVAR